jgi:glycosyltransferase involved in cell wall biosynthesis
MKISLSRHFEKGKAKGLSKFGKLLTDCLVSKYGIKIVSQNKKSDIHLSAISGPANYGAKKNVLRIDGVYYDVNRMNMNRPIKKAIQLFDGVVFQSHWSKVFAETMLKVKAKRFSVIYNGTDHRLYVPDKINISKPHDKMFVCCAEWRVNKRLKTIAEAFLSAKNKTSLDIGLFVIGKPDVIIKDPAIHYLGKIGSELRDYLNQSDYMCHICHLDACPNSVVEGLSAGLPVLCNNIGGTPEIVQKSGISLNLDDKFNFKPIKSMSSVGPKKVNTNIVSQGIIDMINQQWNVSRPDLDIDVSAGKYYEFFCSLLEKP